MATTVMAGTRNATETVTSATGGRVALVAVPLLLALATLAALIVFLTPPYPSDQINYLDAARDFPSVPRNPAIVHQYARLGLVLPMAVSMTILGYSQAAYYIVPVLAAVALVLGVYALGSLLFARAVGLGAAVLTVGNTAIFVDATAPLPDLLAATLFVWAVVLAIAVRQGRSAVVATPRRRVAAMLAIGVILGWSYLAREFIVFVWPLIPVILFRRVSIRDLFWIAVPLGAIGLAEMALNQHIFGDPLARLRVASEHGSGVVPEEAAATYQNKRRLWYLAQLGVAIGDVPEGAWLNAALGAAVAGALVWPRRLGLLLLWIALLYVPLVLLGGVLNPDAPMLRLFKVRYWYPIVPAILLGGVAAAWLATRFVAGRLGASEHRRGLIAGALALVLALVPVAIAHAARADSSGYRANGATQMEAFRSWLGDQQGRVDTIWADSRTVRVARIFTSAPFGGRLWEGAFHTLVPADGTTRPESGDHVMLYSPHSALCGHCRQGSQRIFGSPVRVPPTWTLAFSTADGIVQVYEVP